MNKYYDLYKFRYLKYIYISLFVCKTKSFKNNRTAIINYVTRFIRDIVNLTCGVAICVIFMYV